MANHNLPQTTSEYIDFVTQLDARFDDLCFGLDPAKTTMTNLPVGSVGWSSGAKNWKSWNGTAWVDMTDVYAISISGGAATLSTPRLINTVSFNGSANIIVEPYVERDDTSDATRYLTFVDSSTASHQRLNLDIGLTYNPLTAMLGTNISGNAATATAATAAGNSTTVTNGVYTVGDQTIAGIKTFSSTIVASITGNAATVTNGVYTTGTQTIDGIKTLSGRLLLANGTAAAPSVSFSSDTDTNTGIYWGGENAMYFANNGVKSGEIVAGGNLVMVGNITAYSDKRLKTNLEVIPNALQKVLELTGYTYTRIDSGEKQTGLLAQDLQSVLPEAVHVGEYLSISYGNVVGLLVQAIKELKVELDVLRGE